MVQTLPLRRVTRRQRRSHWAYQGDRYAKCIPADDSGSKGKTRVYHVTADEDVLEDEYDWYATQVYLAGTRDGTSVVRMGGWSEGSQAAEDDLALAFHFDGLLLFDKPM